jgi:hypothetical protein
MFHVIYTQNPNGLKVLATISYKVQGVTFQKNIVVILITMRISDLTLKHQILKTKQIYEKLKFSFLIYST